MWTVFIANILVITGAIYFDSLLPGHLSLIDGELLLLGTSYNLSWRGGGGGVEEKLFFIPNYFQTPTQKHPCF